MEQMSDTYLGLAGNGRAIFRDKASKFIAIAVPVEDEEQARTHLDAIRKEHFDANHHCYAYKIGYDNPVYRMNDDGEPSGSAGKPIYGQILSKGLSDTLVVVVRYFGGTKLGIPGLINAYKSSAQAALDEAGTSEKIIRIAFRVGFPYANMNQVMKIIKEYQLKISNQEFGDQCFLESRVRRSNWTRLKAKVESVPGAVIDVISGSHADKD